LRNLAQLRYCRPVQKTDVPSSNVEVDGIAIRERRKDLGETLTSFAAKAGISFGYLGQIERCERVSISPPMFRRIADALELGDQLDLIKTVN
jgi:transcriptional regulator with XRE-family HTH domain